LSRSPPKQSARQRRDIAPKTGTVQSDWGQQAIRSHNGASAVVEPPDRPVHFISWDAGENITRHLIRNIYDRVLTFAAVAVASAMMAKQVIALIILLPGIPFASK
jgi:hypothetical protein